MRPRTILGRQIEKELFRIGSQRICVSAGLAYRFLP